MNTIKKLLGNAPKITMILLFTSAINSYAQSTWNVDSNGLWSTAANWTPVGVPSAVDQVVNFGNVITGLRSVLITTPQTVGTINFNANNTYLFLGAGPLTLDVSSGSAAINQTGGTAFQQITTDMILNDTVILNNTTSTYLLIRSVLSGTGGVTKNGSGEVILSRLDATSSTYSGPTTVNAGQLTLSEGAGTGNVISGSSNVTINTGGTVLNGSNNRIGDTSSISMNGGVWNLNGYSETVQSLTLTTTSYLDMGTGTSAVLTFNAGASYTAGLLVISNWSGAFGGGGTERIVFGAPVGASFLNNVYWANLNILGAQQLGSGEIVPIPEASNVLAGTGLAIAAIAYEIRRRKSHKKTTT